MILGVKFALFVNDAPGYLTDLNLLNDVPGYLTDLIAIKVQNRNSLPLHIRLVDNFERFKSVLKTHLFKLDFDM